MTPVEWPWQGPGFADLYSACAGILGFPSDGGDQRLEALARLGPDHPDDRLCALFKGDGTCLTVEPGWESRLETMAKAEQGEPNHVALAAAVQGRLGKLFIEFLTQVRARTRTESLCLAGSFFYHSSINTLTKRSGLFSNVFVPVNPGNAGLAVGAALHASGGLPRLVSPFLGPAYEPSEIKSTVENCKLRFSWEGDESLIGITVEALQQGHLVGWFDGAMEWGPRALGARCILASPFSPYVLENLNRFLKHREPWRGYALSAPESAVRQHFDGPDDAPFMECDYRPRDASGFRHVLPSPNAAIRLHTVGLHTPPRFRRLLEVFGSVTGMPFLVNTSFNGFHEPIVCSPRDAVRVFYGTGLDLLILDQFVLTK